jgi:hypothetical protein
MADVEYEDKIYVGIRVKNHNDSREFIFNSCYLNFIRSLFNHFDLSNETILKIKKHKNFTFIKTISKFNKKIYKYKIVMKER